MTESEFVRHMPCENCVSSDAKSLYSDGHTFCFVCHNRTKGDDEIVHNHMSEKVTLKGQAERLNKRNRKCAHQSINYYHLMSRNYRKVYALRTRSRSYQPVEWNIMK